MDFRDRLFDLRRQAGLSQEELANLLGLTRQAVQKWEAGTSRPDMDNLAALAEHKIDMAVLAGFLGILSGDFIDRFGGPIINIHPALIPSFCGKGFYGLGVHRAALDCGVKVTGATVHYVNAIPDGGRIIAQKAVEVREGDTPETLQKRVMREAEWIILPEAVETVCKKLLEE